MIRKISLLVIALAIASVSGAGLLSNPAGFGPEPQSAEAALLNEVRKLTGTDIGPHDEFGLTVAVSGDIAIVGADKEDAGGSNAGAAYIFQRDAGGANNWGEVKKLTASDAEAGDEFGVSVAVNGDTAVVGAWMEDAAGGATILAPPTSSGATRVARTTGVR